MDLNETILIGSIMLFKYFTLKYVHMNALKVTKIVFHDRFKQKFTINLPLSSHVFRSNTHPFTRSQSAIQNHWFQVIQFKDFTNNRIKLLTIIGAKHWKITVKISLRNNISIKNMHCKKAWSNFIRKLCIRYTQTLERVNLNQTFTRNVM